MSDSIVLWRMHVVWNRSRPVLALAAVLLLATLGLNVANIISSVRNPVRVYVNIGSHENVDDTEDIPTYGYTRIGLIAAFMSLISNLSATTLVGIKVWYASITSHSYSQVLCSIHAKPGCIKRSIPRSSHRGIVAR